MTEQDSVPEDSIESDKILASGSVGSQSSVDRRKLFRRLVALAGLGITGVLLSQPQTELIPSVRAQTPVGPGTANGDAVALGDNNSCTATTEIDSLVTSGGVFLALNTGTAAQGLVGITENQPVPFALVAGVHGVADTGTGVFGFSNSGSGVYGTSNSSNGVHGSSSGGTGVYGTSTTGIGGYFQGTPAIYADGNVGIGTNSPTSPLMVVDGTGGIDQVRIEQTGSSGVAAIRTENNSGAARNVFGMTSGGLGFVGTTTSNDLQIQVGNNARIYLPAGGNVGIGTSTPENMLHIGGGATGDIFCGIGPHPNTLVGGSYVGPAMNFGYSGSSFGEGSGFFNVRPDPSATAPNPSLRFMTVNVQRMIITNTGNVGIGTSSPDQLLSVNGNADKSSGGTAWGTFCDKRWKDPDSIRIFELGLEWIRTLPSPVRFRYAEGNGIGADPLEENVNFIAQDLQDGVHDSLVYRTRSKVRATDKEPVEMYGVNVNDMHFAMVNAIKELAEKLAEENDTLREENKELRDAIKALRSRMDAFEQTIKLAAS